MTRQTRNEPPVYWYETQERAFAPGIGDGWPAVIRAPHTKNARLVRRQGDPSELRAACAEALNALIDYVDRLERMGASMNYGRGVIAQLQSALAKASEGPQTGASK